MAEETLNAEQERAARERAEATDTIMRHDGRKKVVIAGPGTGKTHLFKSIFANKADGKMLTLTFINALVEDLSLELKGISEVRTLHGFALSIFKKGDIHIFPDMPHIIQEDGEVLLGKKIDFSLKIHNLDETDGHLDFYSERRKYYDYFGYSDIIMGLVRFFQQHPDKIPEYDQIAVDEFQDFNKLEVELIELLSQKSPILIAGDDDQAIYEFKNSSPEFIRSLHGDGRPEFATFPLPFCSRSTRVIVDAINDFVASAVKNGFLVGRIAKPYLYFSSPQKDKESVESPKIIHKRLQDKQIPWFIGTQIEELAGKMRKKFDVLVISPFSIQCRYIGNALESKGFSAVAFKDKDEERFPYLDGLRILTESRTGNLGWRMVAKARLSKTDFAVFLKKTKDCAEPCKVFLTKALQTETARDLKTLKAVLNGDAINDADAVALLENLGFNQEKVNADFLKLRFGDTDDGGGCDPGVRKIPITITTVQSSKGLSADYVFITHFDSRYIGKGGITNQSICNFLVALTRARKKVWLLSTSDSASSFLGWMAKERIEESL